MLGFFVHYILAKAYFRVKIISKIPLEEGKR
jgi:hypothetical protein